jgi:hypothetical protein
LEWKRLVYSLPFGIYYSHLIHFMAIWYILWPFGIYYGHLEYIMAIWTILWPFDMYILWPFDMYILWPFGNLHSDKWIHLYSPVFVYCVEKNVATLSGGIRSHDP